jgi:cytochrome c5
MQKNNLLITAVVLIAMGIVGIFSTTWIGGSPSFSRDMSLMMGGGMMGRDQMKEMMQGMMSGMLPPGVKPEDLPDPESPGANLTTTYCTQCHNLPSPLMHSAEEWPPVAGRMISRERMMEGRSGMMGIKAPSSHEEEVLLEYLKTHAMKALAPGSIPSPDSPNAALFQQACSRCHALPDPKLHTAAEWPGVVERMRKNMEIMGKPVMTDQEREGIVGYLNQHAR